jgi:hypothetical protein
MKENLTNLSTSQMTGGDPGMRKMRNPFDHFHTISHPRSQFSLQNSWSQWRKRTMTSKCAKYVKNESIERWIIAFRSDEPFSLEYLWKCRNFSVNSLLKGWWRFSEVLTINGWKYSIRTEKFNIILHRSQKRTGKSDQLRLISYLKWFCQANLYLNWTRLSGRLGDHQSNPIRAFQPPTTSPRIHSKIDSQNTYFKYLHLFPSNWFQIYLQNTR